MENNQQSSSNNLSQQPQNNPNPANKSTYQIAYIFMIIGTICVAIFLITLAWMIPMTLATKRCMDEAGTSRETTHTGLGICALLFAGVIAGILILVASGQAPANNSNYNYGS